MELETSGGAEVGASRSAREVQTRTSASRRQQQLPEANEEAPLQRRVRGNGGLFACFCSSFASDKTPARYFGGNTCTFRGERTDRGQPPPPSVAYATDREYVMEQALPGQRHALMSDWRWRVGRPSDVSGAGAP